ncbi:OmpA family protein [Marinomonas dokdonensis]|uniref:OmpA family protein n=1 Tax=Marinomonas dokdonensis TaxID=328224 RepID=UPI0040555CF3
MNTTFLLLVLIASMVMLVNQPVQASDNLYQQGRIKKQLRDDDKDGVINMRDRCRNTPSDDSAIDIYGCTINVKLLLSVELAILFDTGKFDVKLPYYHEIQKVADFLRVHPNAKVHIEGHTDNVGDESYNKELSLNRAQSVANVLTSYFKVDPARVTYKGYGEEQPIADNSTAEGRSRNRRVMAEVFSRAKKDVKRWDIYQGE